MVDSLEEEMSEFACNECGGPAPIDEDEPEILAQFYELDAVVCSVTCPVCASKQPDDDATVPWGVGLGLLRLRKRLKA